MTHMDIYCCGCVRKVNARLTDGAEIYPHRPDLHDLPFWKCDDCKNYVGCHHKTSNRTHPLGIIPTPEIKKARCHVHELLDELWKSGKMKRKVIYAELSKHLGWKYHTANIRSVEEARDIYKFLQSIARQHNGSDSWTHTPSGKPKLVAVSLFSEQDAAAVSSITYDGKEI